MAVTEFYKFHGTGNDFIIIPDPDSVFPSGGDLSVEKISGLCHRRYGIGADGLILLRSSKEAHFSMLYYNADGRPGTMCGNGGRCVAALAYMLKLAPASMGFMASDGLHHAQVTEADDNQFMVTVQLNNTSVPMQRNDMMLLNTGSPHLVVFDNSLTESQDILGKGRALRHHPDFGPGGVNVNFVAVKGNDSIFVRTYERGVENETLSCGTGVTASAIATWVRYGGSHENCFSVETPGGSLRVSFTPPQKGDALFSNIWLSGPAKWIYKGSIPDGDVNT